MCQFGKKIRVYSAEIFYISDILMVAEVLHHLVRGHDQGQDPEGHGRGQGQDPEGHDQGHHRQVRPRPDER